MAVTGDKAIGFWQINLTTNHESHMITQFYILIYRSKLLYEFQACNAG